jgi:serine/threonine-protein kinase
VPAAVDAIVLKALDKDPTKRFQNAGALATAMSSWREARPRNLTLLPSRRPVVEPVAEPEPAPTLLAPVIEVPVAPAAEAAAPEQASPAPRTTLRNDVGCATWAIGIAILLGLLGLIWLGFQLTPRFADLGGGGANPTAIATAPAAANPTAEPPAIAPAGANLVPDLTGMTLDEATAAVRALGLQLSNLEPVFSESVPVDHVAEQDPPPEAPLDQATTIYVKLSRGSATIDLAALDLAGAEAAEAERRLAGAGLAVRREEVPSEDVAAGLVVGTEPADQATIGEQVTLLVSVGDVVLIPGSIQGQPADEARAELERAGLVVTGEIPVGRATIEEAGVDPDEIGIESGDVVGVQGDGADFDTYLPRGAEIELVVYDAGLDEAT